MPPVNNYPAKKSNRRRGIILLITPFFLATITAIFTAFFPAILPHRLPLFYSLPWGEKQIATPQQFFIIPAIIILISLANLIISRQLYSTQVFFKKILQIASLVSSIILTITFIKIVLIFI